MTLAPGIPAPPTGDTLPVGHVVPPDCARQARSALALAVRRKLEQLEALADAAHSLVRLLSERTRAAAEERQQVASHLARMQTNSTRASGRWVPDRSLGPTTRRWEPNPADDVDALQRELDRASDEVARLAAERDGAQARWSDAARLVESCRTYLQVPR